MAHRVFGNVALVGIGIVIGAGSYSLGAAAAGQYWHPGRTVDHEYSKPLSASVTAWPEMKKTGTDGSCPMYGTKALDKETSTPDQGGFKLAIDQSQRTYTVVYCLSDFVPRVDFMPNRKNGTPVEPFPAALWPAKIEPGAADNFDNQVERSLIGFLNNLSYLMTVDQGLFAESIERIAAEFSDSSGGRAAAIRSVRTVVNNWRTGNAQ